jgi:hypothetical protein
MWNATNRSKSQYEKLYILGYTKMIKSNKIIYCWNVYYYVFGWRHEVECNGTVQSRDRPILVFSWEVEWNEVIPQNRIFLQYVERNDSSNLVE